MKDAGLTPEEDIAAARKALADGKLKRATFHVASALSADPSQRDWLALLDRIIDKAPDPLLLVADEPDLPPSEVAARCHILAQQGKVNQAVVRLLDLIAAHPRETAYLSWASGWLDNPEAAGALDMKKVNTFLDQCLQQHPGLVSSQEDQAQLKRLVPFLKKIDASQVTDEHFLSAYASILRKLNRLDEAMTVAQQAYSSQPGYHTAVALAMVHQTKGETDRWLALYQEALRFDPNNVPARLDLGDKLWDLGRLDEAERWYKEALQRDPQHAWCRPSYFGLRYAMTNDEGWKNKLIEYQRANPTNARAHNLVCKFAAYVSALPAPNEVTIQKARLLAEKFAKAPPRDPGHPVRIRLPRLESPSARLALELQMQALGLDLAIDYAIDKIQAPDPRQPRGTVEYVLWKYKGNTPHPDVGEPTPQTASAVAELARQPFDMKEWWKRAATLGPKLGPARVEELLGVMVHPPLPPQGMPPWLWLQHLQVAAALVLAHVDAGWKNSIRRKALLALALGPLDWTVTAGIVALANLALDSAEPREGITKLFVDLMGDLSRLSQPPHAHALICCFQLFPNLSAKERETLKAWRRDLESE